METIMHEMRNTYLAEVRRDLYTADEALAGYNGALLMLKKLDLIDDDTFRIELMSFVEELG